VPTSAAATQSLPALILKHVEDLNSIISAGRSDPMLREQIQNSINFLPCAAIELKRRLNILVPLLRLPPEIIRDILNILSDVDPPFFPHEFEHDPLPSKPSLGWVGISHVCNALREITLNHHSIWAQHVLAFPQALHELLCRAGSSPLNLYIPPYECTHSQEHIQFVVDNMSRAQRLEVDYSPNISTEVDKWPLDPSALSGRSFPFLKTLGFKFIDRTEHWRLVTSDVYGLPPMSSPELSTLCLENFYIPFDPSTLTHLYLFANVDDFQLPTPHQFLDMLGSCTKLRVLSLSSWIPRFLEESPSPTIQLPFLTKLIVDDVPSDMIAFLSRISFQPYTECEFEIAGVPLGLVSEAFHDTLHQVFGRCLSMKTDGLSVGLNTGSLFFTCFKYSPNQGENRQWTGIFAREFKASLGMNIRLEDDEAAMNASEPIRLASRFVDLSSISYLELAFIPDCGKEEHMNIIRPFTRVSWLYLEGCDFTFFASMASDSSSHAPLFPSLRHLWTNKLNLDGPEDRTQFLEILLSRRRAGIGLNSLRIDTFETDSTDISKVVLPRLRAIIPRVETGFDHTVVEDHWHGANFTTTNQTTPEVDG